uniref:Predicted protein n=1 Tax=Hordeum vulgare subsp. vulgare TaxID=112509 RepID=F2DIG3_HORVV|nr:predicted protein [Hordeum vulgare subsp. vulgare]
MWCCLDTRLWLILHVLSSCRLRRSIGLFYLLIIFGRTIARCSNLISFIDLSFIFSMKKLPTYLNL